MEKKAFSAITIKALYEEKRQIEGIASTPAVDRVNDIVEPLGLSFATDAPLLLNHDHAQPVGTVQFGTPTAKGLPFKATIAKVDEEGVVKQRVDEAWHSVKNGLIKGVSIGFIPSETTPLSNGGVRFTKASVHELSLVAIPCNPEAVITAFKSLAAASTVAQKPAVDNNRATPSAPQINHINKDLNMQTTNANNGNLFIRSLIAKAVFDGDAASAATYAEQRWGVTSGIVKVLKALQNPMATDNSAALTAQTISQDAFVHAVFSQSILGQLQGLVTVPALARVNVETVPIAARFVGEYSGLPAYQGAFGVTLADKRKVGLVTVLSAELLRATSNAAEGIVEAQLQRALARGLDSAFVGGQVRDDVTPAGLASVATQTASFDEGIQAFTGDLFTASVLVNPRTAVTLRSAAETGITARGGVYGGLSVITSYKVPVGKLFIVDAARVVAYLGAAELDVSTAGTFPVDDGTGETTAVMTGMFGSGQQAIKAQQYADWTFVEGAAVEVSLSA